MNRNFRFYDLEKSKTNFFKAKNPAKIASASLLKVNFYLQLIIFQIKKFIQPSDPSKPKVTIVYSREALLALRKLVSLLLLLLGVLFISKKNQFRNI